MLIKDTMGQPFRLDQKVVVEKRDKNGQLDFSEPQPPPVPITFREVYKMYFLYDPDGSASAGWSELKAWLDKLNWTVRACTWEP